MPVPEEAGILRGNMHAPKILLFLCLIDQLFASWNCIAMIQNQFVFEILRRGRLRSLFLNHE